MAKSPSKCKIKEVASELECELGKWSFCHEGQALSHIPVFQEIARRHEEVHRLAREIVEATRQGSQGRAERLLQQFEEVRKLLFASLDELSKAT